MQVEMTVTSEISIQNKTNRQSHEIKKVNLNFLECKIFSKEKYQLRPSKNFCILCHKYLLDTSALKM